LPPNVSGRAAKEFRLKVRQLYEYAGEKKLDKALRTLSPREAELIRLRWKGQSQRRVGEQLGVGSARIREIERKIYRKLCQKSRLRMVGAEGDFLVKMIASQSFLSVR
jgi:DNA-directed RNA polymerase sigma subunit (sigma70/sigma32)